MEQHQFKKKEVLNRISLGTKTYIRDSIFPTEDGKVNWHSILGTPWKAYINENLLDLNIEVFI